MDLFPDRYRSQNLRLLFHRPQVIRGEFRRLGNKINKHYYQTINVDNGVDIMDEDWDNLILLDGCRYDVFARQSNLPGEVQYRHSRGSDSWQFISENFADRRLHDTVYITANPHAHSLDETIFHYMNILLEDYWDSDSGTVLPETVAQEALDAFHTFENKRLIVHFMQPHFPFIGKLGQDIDQGGLTLNIDGAEDDQRHIWQQLTYGLTDRETAVAAYRENLDIVLDTVSNLLEDISGKTVISADHGNLIGERLRPIPTRGYGHPRNFPAPGLIKVPWHIIPYDNRRRVKEDPPITSNNINQDIVADRLRDLGYVA